MILPDKTKTEMNNLIDRIVSALVGVFFVGIVALVLAMATWAWIGLMHEMKGHGECVFKEAKQ